MSKKKKFKSGHPVLVGPSILNQIYSSTQIAKGLLATLELEPQSAWIKKFQKTDPEHLRILLQEVMEEILIIENVLEIRMKK